MDDNLWTTIYGRKSMDDNLWTTIYGRQSMDDNRKYATNKLRNKRMSET